MSYFSPSVGDVHVNRVLTNIMIGYEQRDDAFAATQIFPNIPVQKQSDVYFTYNREDWNRDEMVERAPGAESAGAAYRVGQGAYYASIKALHKDIPDQLRANADAPINLDRDATRFLTHKGRLSREIAWTTKYFRGGVWSWEYDGVASGATAIASLDPTSDANNNLLQWNDAASNPIEDMRRAATYMQQKTGFRPNVAAMGRAVYDTLVDHPDFIARMDRGQTSGAATNNKAAIASILDFDKIVVLDAIYNSAKQGLTEVNAFIGGKHALLVYVPGEPSIMEPAAGLTFSWTGYLGASDNGARIKRFRMEPIASDRVEIETAYDMKLVGADLGVFFDGIVA